MTEAELNAVRDLRDEIRFRLIHMSELRRTAGDLVPVLDGMPHDKSTASRTEKIALKLVEAELEIENLRGELETAKAKLSATLQEMLSGLELEVMMMRYVDCKNFRDIQFELNLSDNRVFYLHRRALQNISQNT